MKEKLLLPSMMCADFSNLEKEVNDLKEAGVDSFHIDIMDGSFVPNFGMGIQDLEIIKKLSNISVDIHLMIDDPYKHIDLFTKSGADIIYVHPESDKQLGRTLSKIKENGVKPAVVINPATSIESIKPILDIVDYVMVMTVNPGFAGQKYLDYVNKKIDELLEIKNSYNFEIIVDGAISPEKIKMLSDKGVKGFVLGTSSLFGKGKAYKEIIKELREL